MKFEFNKRYATISIYAFLVLAAALLFYGLLNSVAAVGNFIGTIAGLLMPFAYAFGIAYLLNPVLKHVEHDWFGRVFDNRIGDRTKRGLSILVTYVLAAGVIAVFIMIVIPQLIASLSGLALKLSNYVYTADTWLPQLLALMPEIDLDAAISQTIEQYAKTIIDTAYALLGKVVPMLVSFSTRFASGALSVVVGVIISIYMLMDKEVFCAGLKKIWYAILPGKNADWLLELAGDANRVFGGFINGKLLDSLIIGILCFIGMSLLGMPNVMLVSVIVGVTNIIPYFGPFIGAIPSFFIILIDSPIKALWFLLFILILQQFDGNILGPKILGDSTGLSAFWVIFAIMLFGGLYGFMGMFLGVPVFSVIYMLIRRAVDARLAARDMPLDIESYCAPEAQLLRPSVRTAKENRQKRAALKTSKAHTVKPLGRKPVSPLKDKNSPKE